MSRQIRLPKKAVNTFKALINSGFTVAMPFDDGVAMLTQHCYYKINELLSEEQSAWDMACKRAFEAGDTLPLTYEDPWARALVIWDDLMEERDPFSEGCYEDCIADMDYFMQCCAKLHFVPVVLPIKQYHALIAEYTTEQLGWVNVRYEEA